MTTISPDMAREAGITASGGRTLVETANGIANVDRGTAERLTVGPIERRDFGLFIAREDATHVIGLNFLSTLSRWSFVVLTLVLRP